MTEPFLITYELDLPFPPSINELWRMGRGHLHNSPVYNAWKWEADQLLLSKRIHPKMTITEEFEFHIKLDEARRGNKDADNFSKAVLDYLQTREFIKNDRLCRKQIAEWVSTENAPDGVRVYLRELSGNA